MKATRPIQASCCSPANFRERVRRGAEMQIRNVTIMLPPSRVRLNDLTRLGFEPAGELHHAGQRFLKFRLVS